MKTKIKTTVVNIVPILPTNKNYIYIGRPSKWKNPFIIGINGTREEVIEKYEHYIRNNKELMEDLHELREKVLGCFCKPLACHGDVLIKLLEEIK